MNDNSFKPAWDEEEIVNLDNFNWHTPNSECLVVRQNSLEAEEENNFDSFQDRRQKRPLSAEQISDLHLKKKNLIQFIDNIGQLGVEPIRRDILSHCQKVSSGIYTHISADHIVKLAKNRVQKMIKNKRIKKNWSQQDIKILIWVVSKYCQMQEKQFVKQSLEQNDWEFIANLIPGVTPKSCMFKWLGLKKNNLAQNSWDEQQAALLNLLVKNHGLDKWNIIAEQLYEQNLSSQKIYRCPKQCRQHWNCYLDPKLKKGPWNKQEDYLLLRSVHELDGAKKWAQIVKLFNGRTQNALKNRYNLIIQKQHRQGRNKKKIPQTTVIENYLKKNQNSVIIQQDKLRILKQKRKQLIQTLKNRSGKLCKKQSRKKMPKQQQQQSQEYEPRQWTQLRSRNRLNVQKQQYDHDVNKKIISNDNKYSMEMDHRQISYENLFRTSKQEQPIFEEEQENNSIRFMDIDSRILIEEERYYNKPVNCLMHHEQIGTNQQHLNIDMNLIHVISLDSASFAKLKSQFSQQNRHDLVPCKVTADNCLVKFNIKQNN